MLTLMTLVETKLLELQGLLAEQGIRFIIVLVPSKTSVDQHAFDEAVALTRFKDDDFDLDQPYRRLEEFAALHRIELVNPLNRFRKLNNPDDSLYLTHDKHFSSKGHAIFAQELYQYLTQEVTSLSAPQNNRPTKHTTVHYDNRHTAS